jgi:hypothetical protein
MKRRADLLPEPSVAKASRLDDEDVTRSFFLECPEDMLREILLRSGVRDARVLTLVNKEIAPRFVTLFHLCVQHAFDAALGDIDASHGRRPSPGDTPQEQIYFLESQVYAPARRLQAEWTDALKELGQWCSQRGIFIDPWPLEARPGNAEEAALCHLDSLSL